MILIKKTFRIEEAAEKSGVQKHLILEWIQNEWIMPADTEVPELDEEDIARVCLINNLIDQFGVNGEAVSIILHLLDQIHNLHFQIRRSRG